MLIIWDPGNLGVSSEPGRLLPEAGVPDLEPPPRPLEGGNLPPFLGVYIRSETFLVLISATSKVIQVMMTSCIIFIILSWNVIRFVLETAVLEYTGMRRTGALDRLWSLSCSSGQLERELPRNSHFSVFENAELHRIRRSVVMITGMLYMPIWVKSMLIKQRKG